MDAEKLGPGARSKGCGMRLSLKTGEKSVKPFEAGSVLADPDKLYSSQSAGRIGRSAQVPDILENTSPGCNTDTGADEDGDFIVKDIFSRCSVGAVDADVGHDLSVL